MSLPEHQSLLSPKPARTVLPALALLLMRPEGSMSSPWGSTIMGQFNLIHIDKPYFDYYSPNYAKISHTVLPRVLVTIDGVWIGE
jgi:hypothetical protein